MCGLVGATRGPQKPSPETGAVKSKSERKSRKAEASCGRGCNGEDLGQTGRKEGKS